MVHPRSSHIVVSETFLPFLEVGPKKRKAFACMGNITKHYIWDIWGLNGDFFFLLIICISHLGNKFDWTGVSFLGPHIPMMLSCHLRKNVLPFFVRIRDCSPIIDFFSFLSNFSFSGNTKSLIVACWLLCLPDGTLVLSLPHICWRLLINCRLALSVFNFLGDGGYDLSSLQLSNAWAV